MGFSGSTYGAAKSLTDSIATGFKTAYSNGDGTYTVEFVDGTKVVTAPIKGDKGDQGEQGVKGEQGIQGEQGEKGDRGVNGIGITSIVKQGTSGLVDTYVITFSDGSETTFDVINGANVTKTSQLTNDSDFVTSATIGLINYYLKDEVYSKSKIDELLRNVGAGLSVKIVPELPTEEISGTTIYLINTSGSNYNQYMYIDGDWANLGSTAVDMSSYYNKTQIDTMLLGYITASTLLTQLMMYTKTADLARVAISGSYNDLEDLPEIPSTEGFMKGRQLLGEVDLNDCRTEGTFTITANSANLPSIPIYGTYVDLQVLSIETVVSQIVRCIVQGEPMMWSRCWIVDHWTDWVHAISSDMHADVLEDNSKSYPTSKVLYGVKEDLQGQIDDVNSSLVDIKDNLGELESALNQYPNAKYYDTDATTRLDCNNITDRVALVTASINSYTQLHYPARELLFIMTSKNASGDGVQKAISWSSQREWNRVEQNGVWSAWQELATMDKVQKGLAYTINSFTCPANSQQILVQDITTIGVNWSVGWSAFIMNRNGFVNFNLFGDGNTLYLRNNQSSEVTGKIVLYFNYT